MAPKEPKQGAFNFGPNPGGKRYKQAERMVARGEHTTVDEAMHAIHQKEYASRNQKAKDRLGMSYPKVRRILEQKSTLIQQLLNGERDEDEAISDLWKILRDYIETP